VQINKKSTSHNDNGFTLLELIIAVAILAIVTTIAAPQYRGYILESRAAKLLIQIHGITMAYQHVLQTRKIPDQDLDNYSSSQFGKAPTGFGKMDDLYNGPMDLALSSQLANHSGFFKFASGSLLPVLFLRATTDDGIDLLNALDHITTGKHTFVTPDLLMIALMEPVEHEKIGSTLLAGAHTNTVAPIQSPPLTPAPMIPIVAPVQKPAMVPVAAPAKTPGMVPNIIPTQAQASVDTQNVIPTTSSGNQHASTGSVTSTSSGGSQATAGSVSGSSSGLPVPVPQPENCHQKHPSWPRGWYTHPEKHGDFHCHP
jgi:prepilin-type N-terminal cleavage/methylation domain-containing protein